MTARLSATTRSSTARCSSRVERPRCCSASSALVAGALLPLWRIQLVAPQYPEGLTLDMYAYQIVAGNDGHDLAEINTLNHYIGMKPIAQADFVEMKVMPFAIGVFALLGLRAVVIGRIGNLVDLAVLFGYFGAFSLGSFAYRLYSYGHHLDPKAPMKIEPFMPVVIGQQQIANFVQTSLPLAGIVLHGAVPAGLVAAIWLSRKEERDDAARARSALSAALSASALGRLGRSAAADAGRRRRRAAWLRARGGRRPARPIDGAAGRSTTGRSSSTVRCTSAATAGRTSSATAQTHVVAVRAADVTIDGFEISDSGLDLGKDHAAVHVTGAARDRPRQPHHRIACTASTCARRTAPASRATRSSARRTRRWSRRSLRRPARRPGRASCARSTLNQNRRGNGVHIWNSSGHVVANNVIRDTRDGIYFSFVDRTDGARQRHRRASATACTTCTRTTTGSRTTCSATTRPVPRSCTRRASCCGATEFLANQSHRSYGLLLQTVDDTLSRPTGSSAIPSACSSRTATAIACSDNAIAGNHIGIHISDSSDGNVFAGNSFTGNLHPVETTGGNMSNQWAVDGRGNYWDGA